MNDKVLYLDVETTGTDPKRHAIVEIAWIVEIGGEIATEGSYIVRPPTWAEIDPEAMAVHNIAEEAFRSGTSYEEIHDKLETDLAVFVDRYDTSDKFLLAGYNVRFDFDFLVRLFEHAGDKYLGSWIRYGRFLDPMWAVPFWQYAGVLPDTENLKLATVAQAFGVTDVSGAHTALEDLRMTREVVHAMRSGFRRMWMVAEN